MGEASNQSTVHPIQSKHCLLIKLLFTQPNSKATVLKKTGLFIKYSFKTILKKLKRWMVDGRNRSGSLTGQFINCLYYFKS